MQSTMALHTGYHGFMCWGAPGKVLEKGLKARRCVTWRVWVAEVVPMREVGCNLRAAPPVIFIHHWHWHVIGGVGRVDMDPPVIRVGTGGCKSSLRWGRRSCISDCGTPPLWSFFLSRQFLPIVLFVIGNWHIKVQFYGRTECLEPPRTKRCSWPWMFTYLWILTKKKMENVEKISWQVDSWKNVKFFCQELVAAALKKEGEEQKEKNKFVCWHKFKNSESKKSCHVIVLILYIWSLDPPPPTRVHQGGREGQFGVCKKILAHEAIFCLQRRNVCIVF